MGTCFVIQPFDDGTYDARYRDTFKPAISDAGLVPYRVDEDPSVKIPIEQIERGIKEAELCFAEISTDNPNVWYELGYAFACGKEVVLVCSSERTGKFPFDIQHRHIIRYENSSKSDFENLHRNITEKIKAFAGQSKKIQQLSETPVVATEGLKSNEIAILICLTEALFTPEESLPVFHLQTRMEKAGYNAAALGVGLRILGRKGYVRTRMESEHFNGQEYPAVLLTENGESWIIDNQDKLIFRAEKKTDPIKNSISDDLPF